MTPHSHPKAKNVLQALIQGVDPDTGKELPPDAVSNRPGVLRALLTSVAALDAVQARAQRRALLPPSVGKTWGEEEEDRLRKACQQDMPIPEIAKRHGRTVRAIESRLVKLGLLQEDQRTTSNRYPDTASSEENKE
jgi:hypothetical protein